jgi:hypothetical protein
MNFDTINSVLLYYSQAMNSTPMASPTFWVETIDGERLGHLRVSFLQVADWLNFLVTPYHQADILAAEQTGDQLDIYFAASEWLYAYLEARLETTLEWAA